MKHQVACGLLVRNGPVLLVHRSSAKTSNPNVWDLPSGHLEPGEDSRQALVRELQEELNVSVTPPAGSAIHTRRNSYLVLDVWRVDDWAGEVANAAPDEHDDIGWFNLNEAISLDLANFEYPALFQQEPA
ncbi:NUDIX domain-containing protein [Arthrobacter sp. A2-55]|uniref:NUDIX domain-containing protein n=1 Tax=Arthrobacter sp. A2-55 TaxID=2897337 RepID=UPI0021CD3CB4|nr:NUDIX hydrolase [Arthrobacter sp. A2-55]MCU6480626.1 NUDIX hydrolase [Arthrobacter sp. A2-55]